MSRDRPDQENQAGREDFASRWSRLKRQAKTAPVEPVESGTSPVQAEDERPDEDILKELGLPEPETLKPGDDYSGFMAAAVPARIRNRALRRLWGSKPVLANLDGLVDYAEDFTDAATVPDVFRTAYRVGRGWLEGEDEEEKAVVPDQPEAGEPVAAEEAPASREPTAGSAGAATAATPEEGGEPDGDAPAMSAAPRSADKDRREEKGPDERPLTHARARMRFRFADE